jgi:uroporphyrinogen decarboxylase
LTPRERVQTALGRQKPDRCPLHASFTPEFAERLAVESGLARTLEGRSVWGGNRFDLERAIGEDLLLTGVGQATCVEVPEPPAGQAYVDEWGIGRRAYPYQTRFGTGHYTEVVSHPLAEDAAIASYRAPDPTRPELYADAEEVLRAFGRDYWIVGVVVTTIFETAWALRGFERLLADFLLDPDLADTILDIPYRYHLSAARTLVQLGVDMIWLGDDVGGQDRMLLSPATWRRFLKPRMAAFIAELKALNRAVKIAYHSDGVIDPIIGDVVEIGVDVLNPIQPACVDPAKLARDFGDRLAFWGSIDIQRTLPFGTPEEVRREVRDRLDTLGKHHAFILGPTHHVQLDTPIENFRAMVDAVTGARTSVS